MKLTIEIDDRDFSRLKEALMITTAQYREAANDPGKYEWLGKIYQAREALSLGTGEYDMCSDYKYEPPDIISCR